MYLVVFPAIGCILFLVFWILQHHFTTVLRHNTIVDIQNDVTYSNGQYISFEEQGGDFEANPEFELNRAGGRQEEQRENEISIEEI